jgi:hypothetical protein
MRVAWRRRAGTARQTSATGTMGSPRRPYTAASTALIGCLRQLDAQCRASSAPLRDLLDAPTALAACCGFDLCHKYILYLYLYFLKGGFYRVSVHLHVCANPVLGGGTKNKRRTVNTNASGAEYDPDQVRVQDLDPVLVKAG